MELAVIDLADVTQADGSPVFDGADLPILAFNANVRTPGEYRVTPGLHPTVERIGPARGLFDFVKFVEDEERIARAGMDRGKTMEDSLDDIDDPTSQLYHRPILVEYHPEELSTARWVVEGNIRAMYANPDKSRPSPVVNDPAKVKTATI
jgi:hypothetical protein